MNRNYYLDNIRGIAAIMIIMIHTAWHSGVNYVPEHIRNMTLLFEVPIFFFLAGWSYRYCKSIKNYIKKLFSIQLQYMFFITLIFIFIITLCLIRNIPTDINGINLIKWYFHSYTSMYPFISVEASLWFFPVYFVVSALISTFLTYNSEKSSKLLLYFLILALVLISFKFAEIGNINIFITLNFFVFYSIFYLLGYILIKTKINFRQLIYGSACILTLLLAIYSIKHLDILNLQLYKFPPHFIYFLWSLFGVLIILYLKNYDYYFKKNIFSFFGQNAIYAFFAQGVSSSILFKIVNHIQLEWYFKLPICFIINFIMAFILIFAIKYSYNLFINFIIILKEKIIVIYDKFSNKKRFNNEEENLS